MPSPHSFYGLRVILIVSAYLYMDMNCFGLVRVASSWLRVGSVAVDSFGLVVADGFGCLAVLVATIINHLSNINNGIYLFFDSVKNLKIYTLIEKYTK